MTSITTVSGAVQIEIINGQPTTTSLDIAAHFGKRHDTVLRAIRNLDCSPEFRHRNFAEASQEVPQPNGGVAKYPVARMTRDGFSFLCMGFTGKEAAKWKEAYISAFNQMESALTPQAATLTPAQQRHIQNRVAELARSPGNSFANVYRSIKDQFQVGSYKDVPAERYPALCHYLMTAPLEGELVEGQQQAITQGQHTLTDSQMYEVYVTAFHFAQLHRIFRESRLYDHLTGLGSRIGIDMVDHFTDGGATAAGLLRRHAAEFEGVQRRLQINQYR